MKRIFAFVLLLCMLAPCAHAQSAYSDGIYRGFYYDGGIEQISIQFEMENGLFTSIVYRGVKYKDGDYMIEDASDAQKATLKQYEQMAAYLIGKGVDAIDAAKELIRSGKMAGTVTQDGNAMAECLRRAVENGLKGASLLENMGDYTVDADVAKVRIRYGVYTGE